MDENRQRYEQEQEPGPGRADQAIEDLEAEKEVGEAVKGGGRGGGTGGGVRLGMG